MLNYSDYIKKKTNVQRNISFIPGPEGPAGPQGPKGATGPVGPLTYTIVPKVSAANFYTNTYASLDIPSNSSIPFISQGVNTGTDITQISSTQINLASVSTYSVSYQVSIATDVDIQLTLNQAPVIGTLVGRKLVGNNLTPILQAGVAYGIFTLEYLSYLQNSGITSGVELVSYTTIIKTTTPNTVLSLKNVSNGGSTITLKPPNSGEIMSNITIIQLYSN